MGLEPMTSSLPRTRSTTELHQRAAVPSHRRRCRLLKDQACQLQLASPGRRLERAKGIEPSQPAWKAGALPLSYARLRRPASHAAGHDGQARPSRPDCTVRFTVCAKAAAGRPASSRSARRSRLRRFSFRGGRRLVLPVFAPRGHAKLACEPMPGFVGQAGGQSRIRTCEG